jgi:hypothetical protein
MLSPEQQEQAKSSVCLVRLESPTRAVDDMHVGHLRIAIRLTRTGQLVIGTKYRTYSSTCGHSVPTAPVEWTMMTQEDLLTMLLDEGIESSPFGELREGKPDEIRSILGKPMSEWGTEDKQQVYSYFETNPVR